MDEQTDQKFMELSPVMELMFSQITNMVKYLDLYAGDIDATNLEQYKMAKKGLTQAIVAFEEIYGVSASETTEELENVDNESFEVEPTTAEESPVAQGAGFATGDDEASLAKAKQAVEELKSLFADMKKAEEESVEAPVATTAPVTPVTQPVPQFVNPAQQIQPPATPESVPAQPVMPTPMAPADQQPSAQAQQDAGEIDTILQELRRLQNKGAQQL